MSREQESPTPHPPELPETQLWLMTQFLHLQYGGTKNTLRWVLANVKWASTHKAMQRKPHLVHGTGSANGSESGDLNPGNVSSPFEPGTWQLP